MPVFFQEDQSVLYTHVPKTGGSTIEALFLRSGYDQYFLKTKHTAINKAWKCSPQHYHADILNFIFNVQNFDFYFMTVRHPVSRMISEYKMRNPTDELFEAWIEKQFQLYQNNNFILDNHIRPQAQFFIKGAKVYKQEDRFDEKFCDHINKILKYPIHHTKLNKLRSSTPAFEASKQCKILIEDFYAEDMELFEY